MKRTITILEDETKYRSQIFNGIIYCLKDHFKIKTSGKYVITITEGTRYRFEKFTTDIFHLYDTTVIPEGVIDGDIGGVCGRAFEKIFFVPEAGKRYDITVKKLKKKK